MARERKAVKSATAPHPLLHAFRTTFPECLGDKVVASPAFPVELVGVPAKQWPITSQAADGDLAHWPDIWRLVASGHPEAAKLPSLLPAPKDRDTHEMVHVLLTLVAVMGGQDDLFQKHYKAAENVWRYEYNTVMLGGDGYAPHGLAKALMRHALMAALTYGRKDWAKSFWSQLGNQAFIVVPEPGFVRREEWLFGKGDQHIFGHSEALNRLIQTHWSQQFFSTIDAEGWYVGSPLAGQVAHGGSSFSPGMLNSLLERSQKAWLSEDKSEAGLKKTKAKFKELEDLWEATIRAGQWEAFETLRPWVRPDALDAAFLKACKQGDFSLCQKLLDDRAPAILEAALTQMAEHPLAEPLARPILDLLLARISPRGCGALHQAAKGGTVWLVEALLPHADACAEKSLALRLAVEQGHWTIAEQLWPTSHFPTQETQVIRALLSTPQDQIDDSLIQQIKAIDSVQVANALISNAQGPADHRQWALPSDHETQWFLALTMLPFLAPEGQQHLVTHAISTLLRIQYPEMLLAFLEHVTTLDQIKDWQRRWGPVSDAPLSSKIVAAFRACQGRLHETPPPSHAKGTRPQLKLH